MDLYTPCDSDVASSSGPRRAESRRGRLAEPVRTALRDEGRGLAALPDPVTAIREVGNLFAALDRETERIAAVRVAAVAVLREQGKSYDSIAAATGLSKARAAQLARLARTPAPPT